MWQKTWIVAFTAWNLVNLAQAENWPAWRGAKGDGISQETNLPEVFSHERNVTWKTPLPGPGNSTPIVWEEHVFLTCATENGKVRSLFCLDRIAARNHLDRVVEPHDSRSPDGTPPTGKQA